MPTKPPGKKLKLTTKRERFCREYLVDHNGAAAARRAGFSAKTAARQAVELLHIPQVAARLAELAKAQAERLEISADETLQKIAEVAYAAVDINTVTIADRLRANELLGKHLKLFTEMHEIKSGEEILAAIAAGRQRVIEAGKRNGDQGVDVSQPS